MKTHAEGKTSTSSRAPVTLVPNALAHQAQLRSALRRAGIQPRLKIGAADDLLEHKADAAAEHVMRMPEPEVSPALDSRVAQENLGQATPSAATTLQVSPQAASCLNSLGGGTPLSAESRAFFEPRFGQDFSRTRLHTGANAAHMADALGAKAFTLGNDIVFGAGQYSASTPAGRSLLGHELAHVVQQRNMKGGMAQARLIQRKDSLDAESDELNRIYWKGSLPGVVDTVEKFEKMAVSTGLLYEGEPRYFASGQKVEYPGALPSVCEFPEGCWVVWRSIQVPEGQGGPAAPGEMDKLLKLSEDFTPEPTEELTSEPTEEFIFEEADVISITKEELDAARGAISAGITATEQFAKAAASVPATEAAQKAAQEALNKAEAATAQAAAKATKAAQKVEQIEEAKAAGDKAKAQRQAKDRRRRQASRQANRKAPGRTRKTRAEGQATRAMREAKAAEETAKAAQAAAQKAQAAQDAAGKAANKATTVAARAKGAPRGLGRAAKVLGPIGRAVEVGFGVSNVVNAPPEKRGEVAIQEALAITFGIIGGLLGGLLVLTSAPLWVVALASVGFALLLGELGGALGRRITTGSWGF